MERQDDSADTSEAPFARRFEDVEFYVTDTDAGWAELVVRLGEIATSFYAFSLIFGPLDDIRTFSEEVAASRTSRLLLRGEPGAVEILVEPDDSDGWLQVRIWLINYANVRTFDLGFCCPASVLIGSLRTKSGFLAREDAEQTAREAPRQGLWKTLVDKIFNGGRP